MSSLTGYFEKKDGDLSGAYHIPDMIEDYNLVANKPAINGVVLTSETTTEDLGLDSLYIFSEKYEQDKNELEANLSTKASRSEYKKYATDTTNQIDLIEHELNALSDTLVNGVREIPEEMLNSILTR